MTATLGTRWLDRPETWLGMAAGVLLVADRTQHVGRIVALGGPDAPTDTSPTIELEDGRRIGGLECWWCKREERRCTE